MGSLHSSLCCGDSRSQTDVISDTIQPLDSKTYRANIVHSDKFLESIEQVNSRLPEFDEMDRINKLLDIAEKRIETNSARFSSSSSPSKSQQRKLNRPTKLITKK
jgi:hypothetical protein